ncbi:hypothetical protein HGRIS_000418 [Hohenbuehelia grisea]|uniref:Cytochrome P450 n=1 Tax=Hohenbuehelia grisea TaxID=104357 RepID=A0ABR3JR00_9AGAR
MRSTQGYPIGDIVYINVLGTPNLILGSLEAATDLLETRGNIYSDRPRAVMAGELVGWDRGLGYSPGPPSTRFRAFRRLFHTFIGPRALSSNSVKHAQELCRLRLLHRISKWSRSTDKLGSNLANIVRECTSSFILLLSYGYDTERRVEREIDEGELGIIKDPLDLVQIVEDAMLGFARASEPGAFWADNFPCLKYIPVWFPGASFHRVAAQMRTDLERLYDVPLNYVKQCMANGKYTPSFVSTYFEDMAPGYRGDAEVMTEAEDEELIKAAAASLYSGGAETTPSSMMSFILAMTLYPDVQQRAQEELDRVIGSSDRLPTWDDRDRLPYLEAIVKEVWRWGVSVPLGLAHVAREDDVYRGYTIKKGTVVWANIWSILHDPIMFPEPSTFSPDRYLGSDDHSKLASDAVMVAFGFGRRICPGLHLAESSLFSAIAGILTVFRIEKARDLHSGEEITPEPVFDGFISHPRQFPCEIRPRSSQSEKILSKLIADFGADLIAS